MQTRQLLRQERPVPEQYIVVLRASEPSVASQGVAAVAQELAARHAGSVLHTYEHAFRGFAVKLPEAAALRLLEDPRVAFIEEDGEVQAVATQSSAPWGLDRVDQPALPLNGSYVYNVNGTGVNAYIIDSGIRATHTDFGGRVVSAFTYINDGRGTTDCNGHGTHVAGIVGGATHGIAKGVKLHAVRVLDCMGQGTVSAVAAGVDWVTANHVKPAVANVSIVSGLSTVLDTAVTNSINAGVTYVVAAGNSNADACTGSPARTAAPITVAATNNLDERWASSNFGTCVDLFAPGIDITSAWHTTDTATGLMYGTSLSTAHVTGAAALYLGTATTATPATVASVLTSRVTTGMVVNPGTGSPNKLLYTRWIGDTTAPTTAITAPAAGTTVSGTVTLSANASDNVGVTRVEFYFNSTRIGTDTTAAYSLAWNTTTVANGTYTLTTKAFDMNGNVATSAGITVTVNNASCAITQQLLGNPGFEGGNVNWYASAANVIDGTTTGSAPRTGTWKAFLQGYGAAQNDQLGQVVTIPSTACTLVLKFWLRVVTTETGTTAWDTLTVRTLDNATGAAIQTLATYSNVNAGTVYVERSFTLAVASYRGKTIRLQFDGAEDSTNATGFFIDDTSLTITR
ncbi:S8 family serine peptidase [Archangium sp.]|uniref:S8 family serine peptidase n=1 Tax=Archangium sp. TaxID=1872627 RepID=UPI002EDA420A